MKEFWRSVKIWYHHQYGVSLSWNTAYNTAGDETDEVPVGYVLEICTVAVYSFGISTA